MSVAMEKILEALKLLARSESVVYREGSLYLDPKIIGALMVVWTGAPQMFELLSRTSASKSQVTVLGTVNFPPGYSPQSSLCGAGGIFSNSTKKIKDALGSQGLGTIGDLAKYGHGMLTIPGFGLKSFAIVKEILIECGFEPEEFWCIRNSRAK